MRFARIRKTKYYVLLILIVTVSILLTLSRLKRDTIDWLQELEKLTNQVVALLTLDTWLDRKGVLNNEEYLPAKVETYIINNAKENLVDTRMILLVAQKFVYVAYCKIKL